jgi:hypothetical protein
MCLQISSVKPWDSWNWSGDEIIHKPIIRASRWIPTKKKRYDIDLREFLTTKDNAVVAQTLGALVSSLPAQDQALFRSHGVGSFDFRADKVAQLVGTLRYKKSANKADRCPDAWLFPDETLAQKYGDCEDLAFLLAALLLASGISAYCVRVALGSLRFSLPKGTIQKHDHCWVMYQNEGGAWEILEPVRLNAAGMAKASMQSRLKAVPATEYVPHYVFNTDHLWLVNSRYFRPEVELKDYIMGRSFWDKFDPGFAASVHNTMFDEALGDLASADAISAMKRQSLYMDANIATYDPCDHFDNGYIEQGWQKVNERLATFKSTPSDWKSFGAAAHGIGDFYAHSSYLHFAPIKKDEFAIPYEPGMSLDPEPAYTDPPLSLTSGLFSVNSNLWDGTQQTAADHWAGELISGRYAQKYDPQATFWEGFTSIPFSLASAADFKFRGSLPHHDEIAVDEEMMKSRHKLYSGNSSGPDDRQAYANQFLWRKNTAVHHIRRAYQGI